eukprot:1582365-Alexandrium_andersonii.AAC.1
MERAEEAYEQRYYDEIVSMLMKVEAVNNLIVLEGDTALVRHPRYHECADMNNDMNGKHIRQETL